LDADVEAYQAPNWAANFSKVATEYSQSVSAPGYDIDKGPFWDQIVLADG